MLLTPYSEGSSVPQRCIFERNGVFKMPHLKEVSARLLPHGDIINWERKTLEKDRVCVAAHNVLAQRDDVSSSPILSATSNIPSRTKKELFVMKIALF